MINRRSFLGSAVGLGLGLSNLGQRTSLLIGQGKESNRGGEHLTDLEAIFHKDPPIPVMREVARTYIRRMTRHAAKGKPLTGTFYWVPVPKSHPPISPDGTHESDQAGFQWTVQEFFDCWTPSSDHTYVWKHVLDSMSCRWRLPIPQLGYGSLPRGRVCRLDQGPSDGNWTIHVICHGQDCPQGPFGLNLIRRLFQLDPSTPAIFSDREQLITGQLEALAKILGLPLGMGNHKGAMAAKPPKVSEGNQCRNPWYN